MFCPNCGTKHEDYSVFCSSCGTQLKAFQNEVIETGHLVQAHPKKLTTGVDIFTQKLKSSKRTRNIFCASAVIALILIILIIVSCLSCTGNDDSVPLNNDNIELSEQAQCLLGMWVQYEGDQREKVYYFYGNGKFKTVIVENGNELSCEEKYNWSDNNDTITLYYDDDQTREYKFEFDGDYLFLTRTSDTHITTPLRRISSKTTISDEDLFTELSNTRNEYRDFLYLWQRIAQYAYHNSEKCDLSYYKAALNEKSKFEDVDLSGVWVCSALRENEIWVRFFFLNSDGSGTSYILYNGEKKTTEITWSAYADLLYCMFYEEDYATQLTYNFRVDGDYMYLDDTPYKLKSVDTSVTLKEVCDELTALKEKYGFTYENYT